MTQNLPCKINVLLIIVRMLVEEWRLRGLLTFGLVVDLCPSVAMTSAVAVSAVGSRVEAASADVAVCVSSI